MKVVFSFLGFKNDYLATATESGSRYPDRSGPTFSFHKHFWGGSNYDKHIILNTSNKDRDKRNFKNLLSELRKEFPERTIESNDLLLDDVIDVVEIYAKLNAFLATYSKHQLEAFISPGTPAMQISWYLLGTVYRENLKIFQTRAAQFAENNKPERIYVRLDSDIFPTNVTVAQASLDEQNIVTEEKIKITNSLKAIYQKALKIALTDHVGCLILGENGTGKENLAEYIHKNSLRKNKPFIAINCAAYSDELLRSELFGYTKGAFTGAEKDKKGVLEEANGGTIFLDEIGDISKKMQVTLLRILQEKKVQAVGSVKEVAIDVRVIAATNKNLEAMCESEDFRWDLFYRLAVTTLKLPSLRERGSSEIEEMILHFNQQTADRFPERKKLKIPAEIMKRLRTYGYKGNVRELENLFIQCYTFCEDEIRLEDLPARILGNQSNPLTLEEVKKAHILKVVKDNPDSSLVELSQILGCTRDTLRKYLKEYGVYEGID
jgi:transcriptional regulator with PAS, ATPase and Fis domain